jgi:hypothetical protein
VLTVVVVAQKKMILLLLVHGVQAVQLELFGELVELSLLLIQEMYNVILL